MKIKYSYLSIPFFILISFNSTFSLSEYLSIYTLSSFPLIFNAFFNNYFLNSKLRFSKLIDLPIVFLIIYLVFISCFTNSDKTINYLIAYVYIFIFLYFSYKQICQDMSFNWINKYNRVGIYITTIFIIINFIIFKLFSINIQELLPRIGPVANAQVNASIIRSYGFSIEPTVLSAYLLSFGTLALYTSYAYKLKDRYLLSILVSLSILLTFSAGAIASLFISVVLVNLRNIFNLKNFNATKINKFRLLSLFTLTILFLFIFINPLFKSVTDKILFLDSQFGSGRGFLWIDVINKINLNNFLPHGLGSASESGNKIINWYLQILYDGGFIPILLILIHIYNLYRKIENSLLSLETKFIFSIITLTLFIQLNVFSTFYYPYAFLFGLSVREICSNKINKLTL